MGLLSYDSLVAWGSGSHYSYYLGVGWGWVDELGSYLLAVDVVRAGCGLGADLGTGVAGLALV